MPKINHTAPRKKRRLLRWVQRWNRKNPDRRIRIPKGFNPKTPTIGTPARELIKSVQRAAKVKHISGQFDEPTMRLLFPPGVRGQVMAVAHSQLGLHEWPAGSNWGPIKKFLQSIGLGPGNPWCAAFVCWVLRKAGYTGPLPTYPGWVDSWVEMARKHGCLKDVNASKLGDLWVWHFRSDKTAHISFCDDTNMKDPEADGLDGNVGDYGGEVTHVTRSEAQISYCIDVVKLSRLGWKKAA